jgi:hypothetical protein
LFGAASGGGAACGASVGAVIGAVIGAVESVADGGAADGLAFGVCAKGRGDAPDTSTVLKRKIRNLVVMGDIPSTGKTLPRQVMF